MLTVEQELDRPKEGARTTDAGTDAATPVATPKKPLAANEVIAEGLSYEAYIARGKALLEDGEVSVAQRFFEQALFVHPSSAQAHVGLGYVALEKNRPQLAVEHFLPAARAGRADALIGLGDAYRRLGRTRDALKAYQGYLAKEPEGAQASIARAQIEKLAEAGGSATPGH
jgi:tetratricopeptide (TPR) repeat protein